jgi:predicted metal-binding membrane protein
VSLRHTGTLAVVLATATLGWAIVVDHSDTLMMDGGALPYLALWIAMTAAMMLPSAAPMLLLVDRLSHRATPLFALGYVASWTAFGVLAYLVSSNVDWHATAALLAVAGVYQLLPLKRSCLRRCRNPLGFLRAHSGEPPFVVGVRHGAFCVGCCAGLMVVLLALGMASIVWMAVLALAIALEKTWRRGELLAAASAIALLSAASWMVLA